MERWYRFMSSNSYIAVKMGKEIFRACPTSVFWDISSEELLVLILIQNQYNAMKNFKDLIIKHLAEFVFTNNKVF